MTKHPVALAIALAFATSTALSGCDRPSNLTEQEHIQRAKDFEDKGNLKGSIIELKNAIQKNPDNPQARLLLGETYLKAGHFFEAEKELRRARKLGVASETVLPALAQSLIRQGQYLKVLDEIEVQPEFSPLNRSRLQSSRADALINTSRVQDACTLYDQARQTSPRNPAAHWGLALCAQIRGDSVAASQLLQDAARADPDNATTWLLIGNLERRERRLQPALDAYKKAVQLDPANIQAHAQLGAAYLAAGDFKSARSVSKTIEKIAPGHPEARYLNALALFLEKKPSEALPLLLDNLKEDKHVPSAVLFGAVQLELGSLEQAERALGGVISQFPGHDTARRFYVATLIKMGDADRARAALKPLFDSGRVDGEVLRLAGEASMLKGEYQEAEQYFSQASTLSPGSAIALSNLGRSELAQGNVNEAVELFGQASSLTGKPTQGDLYLVATHLRARQFGQALQAAQKLEQKSPGSPIVQQMLAAAYDGLGDTTKARAHLLEALKHQPDYLPAARALVGIELKANNIAGARRHLESVLERNPKHTGALISLAEFDRQHGKPERYIDGLKKAQQSNPKSLDPVLLLGQHHLSVGAVSDALTLAQAAVRDHPDDARALELLGKAQLANGNAQNAKVSFERAIVKQPQAAHLHALLGSTLLVLDDFKSAREAFTQSLKLDPASIPAFNGLITLNMREKKEAEALSLARTFRQTYPNRVEPLELEADIQLARSDWEPAAQLYRQAMELKPSSVLQVKLHRAVSRNGALAQHDKLLDQWIAKHPRDTVVLQARADMKLSRRDLKGAAQDYRTLLEHEPNHVQSLNNLAFLLMASDQKAALAYAERATKLAPDNPRVLDTLGVLLSETGSTKRALATLARAVEIVPDYPLYRLHYAEALIKAGDKKAASSQLAPLVRLGGSLGEKARSLQKQTR